MVKVLSIIKMNLYTMEIGWMIRRMEMDRNNIVMVIDTKVNGNVIRNMALVLSII